MSEIRRWNVSHARVEREGCTLDEYFDRHGKYVLYYEHAAAITAKDAEIEQFRAGHAELVKALERIATEIEELEYKTRPERNICDIAEKALANAKRLEKP